MVNPLSTNSVIIGTNPYSFLMKSTAETRAKLAAKYAIENYEKIRMLLFFMAIKSKILYLPNKYKSLLEADSFNISWMAASRDPMASTEILRTLTEVFDADTIRDSK